MNNQPLLESTNDTESFVSFDTETSKTQSLIKNHTGEKIYLNDDSALIAWKDNGIVMNYIVGSSAQGLSGRSFGADVFNTSWMVIVAARLALSLGAGNHKIDFSLIISPDTAEKFTGSRFSTVPTQEVLNQFHNKLSDIYFMRKDTDVSSKDFELCHIEFNSITLINEIDAVAAIIPKKIEKAIVLQCGYGDTQLGLATTGTTSGLSYRSLGLASCIKDTTKILNDNDLKYNRVDVLNGWDTNLIVNREMIEDTYDFTSVKQTVVDNHYQLTLARLTQECNADYSLFKGVILSGGAVNDPIVRSSISSFFEREGKKTYLISELCEKLSHLPSEELYFKGVTNTYAAVYGALLNKYDSEITQVGLDAGNGWSKIAVRKS